MLEHGADLGLAFDGDADRCFVIDERGEAVSPSAITALVATREIAREAAAGTPAETVRSSTTSSPRPRSPRSSPSTARAAVRTRVGHSFIKAEMADAGRRVRRRAQRPLLLPRLLVRRHRHARGHARPRRPRRAGRAAEPAHRGYSRYAASGEINSTVTDAAAATERVRAVGGRPGRGVRRARRADRDARRERTATRCGG